MNGWREEGRVVEVADRQFRPLVQYMGSTFGVQAFDVAAEVRVEHDHLDDRAGEGGSGLLVDRHVDPDTELPLGCFVDRETPGEDIRRDAPYLSLAVRPEDPTGRPHGGELYDPDARETPHAREWDFLCEHAAAALEEFGVGSGADDADKAHAFAEYAMKSKKPPTYGSFHPVDVLLHSSYCTGAANVLSALASVEGIPNRHCCISNHTMTELFLEGRWHFADNHADGARLLPGSDYVDVTLHADRYGEFSEKQRGYLTHRRTWARSPWHYSGMLRWHWAWGAGAGRGVRTGVMDGYGVGVPCDPRHAGALYPERKSYPFPCRDGRPELTLTEKGSWLRVDLPVPPGQAVLKEFYVGECTDNPAVGARIEWWLRPVGDLQNTVLLLDGRQVQPDGVSAGTGMARKVCFELPVSPFEEPGRHSAVLLNRSDEELRVIAYPTPVVKPPAIATMDGLQIHPQSLTREPVVV